MNIRRLDKDFVPDRRIGDDPLLTEILQGAFGDMQSLADLLLGQSFVRFVRCA